MKRLSLLALFLLIPLLLYGASAGKVTGVTEANCGKVNGLAWQAVTQTLGKVNGLTADAAQISCTQEGTTAADSTVTWTGGTNSPGREIISKSNPISISGTGTATKGKVCIGNNAGDNIPPSGATIKFKVWRQNGEYFDFIGSTEAIAVNGLTQGTVYEFTFSNQITGIQNGDYVGVQLSNYTTTAWGIEGGASGGTLRYKTGDASTVQTEALFSTDTATINAELTICY